MKIEEIITIEDGGGEKRKLTQTRKTKRETK